MIQDLFEQVKLSNSNIDTELVSAQVGINSSPLVTNLQSLNVTMATTLLTLQTSVYTLAEHVKNSKKISLVVKQIGTVTNSFVVTIASIAGAHEKSLRIDILITAKYIVDQIYRVILLSRAYKVLNLEHNRIDKLLLETENNIKKHIENILLLTRGQPNNINNNNHNNNQNNNHNNNSSNNNNNVNANISVSSQSESQPVPIQVKFSENSELIL